MKNNKKVAFSLVEIIITITIIVLLAVIGVSGKKGYDDNMNNTKVLSDTETINNALESYSQENAELPMPGGNTNYYTIDTTYAHSYDDAFGVYGSLTEETIAKKYLDTLPLDPRTNSYYAYGKTKDTNQFEIASIQVIDSVPTSKVVGNYTAEVGPYNLIREYNGPNFVYNGSTVNLPYNPEELILIATDKDGTVYREGDTIESTVSELEIFFSDGSVSILEPNSTITLNKLNFKNEDNLNTIVKLGLEAGKIWTRATKLNDESEFEVYTTDSSASVRGTIFSVENLVTETETVVIEGEVEIEEIPQEGENETTEKLPIQNIKVKKGEKPKKLRTYKSAQKGESEEINDDSADEPEYSENEEIRSEETVNNNEEAVGTTSSGGILYTASGGTLTTTCYTFMAEGKCMDSENTLNGWKLAAYAPYNSFDVNIKNINHGYNKSFVMYGSGEVIFKSNQVMYGIGGRWKPKYDQESGILETHEGGCTQGCNLFSNGFEFNTYNHIIRDRNNNNQGIYIDDRGNDSYLKYNLGIDTSQDFAIEMNVRFPNYSPSGNRGLFHMGDYRVQLKSGGDIKLFAKSNINNINSYYDGNFHKIISRKDGNNYIVSIDNKIVITGAVDPSKFIGNYLYVGSKNDRTEQLSDIIDYVKIYVKEENNYNTTNSLKSQN